MIPKELKVWMNNCNNKPTAEAIRAYKKKIETESEIDLLSQTNGLWKAKNIDGLKYVESLRNEW